MCPFPFLRPPRADPRLVQLWLAVLLRICIPVQIVSTPHMCSPDSFYMSLTATHNWILLMPCIFVRAVIQWWNTRSSALQFSSQAYYSLLCVPCPCFWENLISWQPKILLLWLSECCWSGNRLRVLSRPTLSFRRHGRSISDWGRSSETFFSGTTQILSTNGESSAADFSHQIDIASWAASTWHVIGKRVVMASTMGHLTPSICWTFLSFHTSERMAPQTQPSVVWVLWSHWWVLRKRGRRSIFLKVASDRHDPQMKDPSSTQFCGKAAHGRRSMAVVQSCSLLCGGRSFHFTGNRNVWHKFLIRSFALSTLEGASLWIGIPSHQALRQRRTRCGRLPPKLFVYHWACARPLASALHIVKRSLTPMRPCGAQP